MVSSSTSGVTCVADLPLTTVWAVLLGGAIGTFLLRVSFVEALAGREIPRRVERALAFVPPAVLAALVLPKLLLVDGSMAVSLSNHRLLAGIVAAGVAYRTEDMLWTVGVGMGVLWSLTWLGGGI